MTDTLSKTGGSSPTGARKKKLVVIVAALLVAVGLAVPAALFGPKLLGFDEPRQETETGAPPGNAASPELIEYRNDQVGLALSYPSSWAKLPSPDPQVLLVASKGPLGTVLLRAVELPTAVGKEELGAAKQLTDQIIGANQTAKLLVEPAPIERAGMPGYWYFYTFKDETGQEGAHSHLFLFKGKTMFSLVLETVPSEQFKTSAGEFDQIINSIRVVQK